MSNTFYLNEPLQGKHPADWLRTYGKPDLTISAADPVPWVEYLRDNKLPCIIVKNLSFNPVGVLMSEADMHRWRKELSAGRWIAFYMAPRDKLIPLLPPYVQAHLARQLNIVDRLRLAMQQGPDQPATGEANENTAAK